MVLCDDMIGHVTRGSLERERGGGGGEEKEGEGKEGKGSRRRREGREGMEEEEEEGGKAATQHNLVTSPGRRLCGSLHAHTPLLKT